jgi:hypothetical protein
MGKVRMGLRLMMRKSPFRKGGFRGISSPAKNSRVLISQRERGRGEGLAAFDY